VEFAEEVCAHRPDDVPAYLIVLDLHPCLQSFSDFH
jgi:hypothetical protein